jgi:hypothetical protein
MARRLFSIRSLVRARPPLTNEQLADHWVNKNAGAIAEIAMRSMMDPVGTVYDVPPLRIVAFQTSDARILYQLALHKAARAQDREHITGLAEFCRDELLTALSKLDVQATFQPDAFAGTR